LYGTAVNTSICAKESFCSMGVVYRTFGWKKVAAF